MNTVHYSKVRMIIMFVGVCLFVVLGAWANARLEGRAAFAGFILMCLGAITFPIFARYMLIGAKVLEFDSTIVTFHGLLGSKTVRWDRVTSIDIYTVTVNWFSKTRHLRIHGPFGIMGYASISEKMLTSEHRPLEKLIAAISEAHARPARQAPRREETAIIPASPMPREAGFGRKGI
ncbi:hypothetical protein [Altererythrobacter sp.]|uniref:hypothetical protein n=1 Tax=Altererythrobacter sp. TaxID=1872480 RepID=UPI003D0CD27A